MGSAVHAPTNNGTPSPPVRDIAARWVITGTLTLVSPTHLGAGEAGETVDLPVLRDALNPEKPFLMGSTIAGALRDYLRSYEFGNREAEVAGRPSLAAAVFGGVKGDDFGVQGAVVVNDALGTLPKELAFFTTAPIERREGVAIDGKTRLAADGAKYNFEVLPAGTTFELRLEALEPGETAAAEKLREGLAIVLDGLTTGEIMLGARTAKGLGRCRVGSWTTVRYDLHTQGGLLAWLREGYGWQIKAGHSDMTTRKGTAFVAMGVTPTIASQRRKCTLTATFAPAGGMLIRSPEEIGSGAVKQPDDSHIRSLRVTTGKREPVLPGTSLGGALRARARRILHTLLADADVQQIEVNLFGGVIPGTDPPKHCASKLLLEETPLDGVYLAQTRVTIDRFTGGALDTALFTEGVLFEDQVHLTFVIEDPEDREIGLLLHLLKDLWVCDLPLGGSSSVGRGRLHGVCATFTVSGNGTWTLIAGAGGTIYITPDTGRAGLESYAAALASERNGGTH